MENNNKIVRILRSATIYEDFDSAKIALGTQLDLDEIGDGVLGSASYKKVNGEETTIHTLLGLKRITANGNGESYYQDIEATEEQLASALEEIERVTAVSLTNIKNCVGIDSEGKFTLDGSTETSVKGELSCLQTNLDNVSSAVENAQSTADTAKSVAEKAQNDVDTLENEVIKNEQTITATFDEINKSVGLNDKFKFVFDGSETTVLNVVSDIKTKVETPIQASEVVLAEIKDNELVKLEATNVQEGLVQLFKKMIENEEVTSNTVKSLIDVLGAASINVETGEITYVKVNNDIIKDATSFTEADFKLAQAINDLQNIDRIDCGTF